MAVILLIFLRVIAQYHENWNKKHFPEGEFQRNLAQSSRLLIETQNWNTIWKFLLLRDFTDKITFCHVSKYANLC